MTKKVSILYHMFPHYRAPILRSLFSSDIFQYKFYGSHHAVHGIKGFPGDDTVTVNQLDCVPTRSGFNVHGMSRAIASDGSDVVVLLGNPNILQTWRAAIVARAMGKKVLFWAHGWLKPESRLKARLRNLYFGLGNGVLVYSDRARTLAAASGFDAEKVFPIYNSLDWDVAEPLFRELEKTSMPILRQGIDLTPDQRVLICTARLTPLCRFDLLLEAMEILNANDEPVTLILVGDGPQRVALEAQAAELALDVRFMGAIYNEVELSRLIYIADMTVSPGKVGLTAMHSLTYGTPVVTHSDLDQQMPEVEAIIEGETGAFFRLGDAADLAKTIGTMLADPRPRAEIRKRCRAVMLERYTPSAQRALIEAAIAKVLGAAQ